MTTSVQPLSDVERKRLITGFTVHLDHPGRPYAEAIYRAGMHPIVLSEPDAFDFHIDGENLRWTRPKNSASMLVPMDPDLQRWFPSWWATHKPVSRQTIFTSIRDFGLLCDIQNLGPRSLRHTFIWRLAQVFPPDEVARKAGCTTEQALDYARMARTKTDEAIQGGGLPA